MGSEYRLIYPQRDITINDTSDGFNVNQQGTGDIVEFFDAGVSVWRLQDGGAITYTGTWTFSSAAPLIFTAATPTIDANNVAANLTFLARRNAANTGVGFTFQTLSAADAITNRLTMSSGVATAVATWATITHTGIVLSGALDANNQIITNIGVAGTDFTATGGLTLADILTVSAGGAAITGNISGTNDLTLSGTAVNLIQSAAAGAWTVALRRTAANAGTALTVTSFNAVDAAAIRLTLSSGVATAVFTFSNATISGANLTSPTITTSPTAVGATWTDLGTVTTAAMATLTGATTASGAWTFSAAGVAVLISNNLRVGASATPTHLLDNTGIVSFNEQGADIDFRIRSDNNLNMFVIDAAAELLSFGEAANIGFSFNVAPTDRGVGNGGAVVRMAGNATNAGPDSLYGFIVGPHTLTKTAAITEVAAARFRPPTLAGIGAATNAATVKIDDAPTGATNNFAFWVAAGAIRLDRATANGTVATAMSSLGPTGSNTTIQEWLTININGTVRYIPCF